MKQKLILILTVLISSVSFAQPVVKPDSHHWLVDALADRKSEYVFRDFAQLNEALKERNADSLTVYVKPWVYWIDDPDDPTVRRGNPPIGMTIRCRNLTIIGLGKTPDETVLACQRGQSQGADGNFTMLNFICEDLKVRNITFGDYLNVDLDYKVNPRLSRPKRSSVITQGQLAFMEGRRLTAENCRFVSRLNLCPIVGADYSEYCNCHFESTDDALNGNARYEDCDFDFYGSRPLYNTSGRGATFIRCTFNIHHNGSQFFTKRPGKVKVVDSRFLGPDSIYIGWSGEYAPWIRCYQAGNTINGRSLFIDRNHPELTASSADKAYEAINTSSTISTHNAVLKAGSDTAILKATASACSKDGEKALPLAWSVEKGYEQFATLDIRADGSCRVIPENNTAMPTQFCITAIAGDTLAKEACMITVNPKERPVPRVIRRPKVIVKNGTATVDYRLDLGDASDCSDIKWYRTTKDGRHSTHSPEEVAASSLRPEKTYRLRPSDIGTVIEARVFAKSNCSQRAEEPLCAGSRRITSHDISIPFVLETDFSDLPRLAQHSDEDNWSGMRFKPEDTKDYTWDKDDPAKFATPWYYGHGTGGCKDSLGLLENIQGSRLVYHPRKGKYGNISLELDVTPAKTAGQGFSSNRMQYMDVCIKYDDATMSGYGLRIIRTLKHGNAVDFQLMRFENGKARPLSEAVSSTCYRGNSKICMDYHDGILTAKATTDAKASDTMLPNEVSLSAKVEPNSFGDFVIQHTGTTGEGQTMLRHLKLKYDE